jgi:hypothetical protein
LGWLKVINGTDSDGVVKLIGAGVKKRSGNSKVYRFVYVRANSEVTLGDVGEGSYGLFFCTGTDWDNGSKSFGKPRSAQRFDETLRFTETVTGSGIGYRGITVTLHPVPQGSATTTPVDLRKFNSLQ